MSIIAITNRKGGTGKTTTSINLGAALASMGKRILLIDLDPQANLTYSFGIRDASPTIAEVLSGEETMQTILTEKEGLRIAPSAPLLADVELNLVSKIGRERFLKDVIAPIRGDYDYIFIDCPPSLSVLTVNALNAADEVLIPAQMEVLSLEGLFQLLSTIKEVRQVLNKKLAVLGIVPVMYDGRRRLSEEVLQEIKANIKETVFDSHIRENVKIAEAPSFAQSVIAYAPSSHGAEDYKTLAREFLERSAAL